MLALEFWLWALCLFPIGAALWMVGQSFRARRRWGTTEGPVHEAGDGGYRSAPVRSEVLLGTPRLVTVGAVLASVWGAITLLLFVPAGLVLTAASAQESGGEAWLLVLSLCASLSGVVVALGLLAASHGLVRRSRLSVERAILVARYSHIHHAVIWGAGFAVALVLDSHFAPAAFVGLALPCGMGLFVGHLLTASAEHARAMRHAEIFGAGGAPPADAQVGASSSGTSSVLTSSGPTSSTGASSPPSSIPASSMSTSGRTKLVSS